MDCDGRETGPVAVIGDFLRALFGRAGNRSPAEPVRFEHALSIKGRAEDIYPLVDWGDNRHLWRQQGHKVRSDGELFTLTVKELPGTRFEIIVTDAVAPSFYAYDSVTLPMIGKLIRSHEEYRIVQVSEQECRVTLTVDASFVAGLRPRKWRFEQWKMQISCHNALEKLKLMVEEGLDAVEIASRRLVV